LNDCAFIKANLFLLQRESIRQLCRLERDLQIPHWEFPHPESFSSRDCLSPSYPNPAPDPSPSPVKALSFAPMNAHPVALTARADKRFPPP
jgi:hypothetical protein